MNSAVIVSGVRTAVGKAKRGTLKDTRPDDLAAFAIEAAINRVPNLDSENIDDVIVGCAMPEGPARDECRSNRERTGRITGFCVCNDREPILRLRSTDDCNRS